MTLPAVVNTAVHRHRQTDSLAQLFQALDFLTQDADRLAKAEDIYALADGLETLRQFKAALGDVERHVEDYVVGLMDQDQVNLGDEFTLERHGGRTRKRWDSEELLKRLVGSRIVNADTGEDVTDALYECVPITASLAWRVGALRKRGIQVDEWCEEAPARTTVQIRARKEGT